MPIGPWNASFRRQSSRGRGTMEYAKLTTPWLTLFLLATFCVSIDATVRHPQTMTETLPAYALTGQVNLLNATACRAQLQEFRDAVDRSVLWSLRMLDASGERASGFVNGNNDWLGARQQCDFLGANGTLRLSEKLTRNNSMYRDPNEEFPPFDIHFFVARANHNSTLQYQVALPKEDLVTIGLCLPASCTVDEIGTMLTRLFEERTFLAGQLYAADFTLVEVSDLIDDHQWLLSGKVITIILILGLLCTLAAVGTVYDLLVYQKRLQKKKEFLTFGNNNTAEMKHDPEEKRESDHEEAALADLKPESSIEKLLVSFSVYSNVQQIFTVEANSEGVPALHGLKFLGMIWIIMVHTIFYGNNVFTNRVTAVLMSSTFITQIISNSTLSVDTYFCVSGFLLSYVVLKTQQKGKRAPRIGTQVNLFLLAIVKRYIRLTPAYFVVILMAILNFSWYDKFSLHRYAEPINELCTKYWWRDLLYINNFFEWNKICLSWTWYLSNDMQLFMFGSFILILSTSHYVLAVGISAAVLATSIALNAYTAYSLNYTLALDEQYATLSLLYVRPWLRIPPFIIGMGTAHLLAKWNYQLHLTRRSLAICWTLAILCNCSILFGIINKPLPLASSVLYTALCRTGWGIGVGWLIIACCTNNAGIVNQFLSLPVWVPLSRLTYCAYLLNPFLIISIYSMSNYPVFAEFLTTGTMFLGFLVVTYICALPLSVLTEVPTILFLRVLMSKHRVK